MATHTVLMPRKQSIPGSQDTVLSEFTGRRMPPSESSVGALHRETTICYAYLCSYAYGCTEKSGRPAQVLMRRCLRYMPDNLKIEPALSDLALDTLAKRRQSGGTLDSDTERILDRMRPNGPFRKFA